MIRVHRELGWVAAILLAAFSAFGGQTNSEVVIQPPMPTPVKITLAWQYPPGITNDPTLGFIIYQTTNLALPLSNWTTLATVMASNSLTYSFYAVPAQYFWVVQSSNWWGGYGQLGQTSNIASTPPAPANVVSNSVTKGP